MPIGNRPQLAITIQSVADGFTVPRTAASVDKMFGSTLSERETSCGSSACQCVWFKADGADGVITDLAEIVAAHLTQPNPDHVITITAAPRIASCFNAINASLTRSKGNVCTCVCTGMRAASSRNS